MTDIALPIDAVGGVPQFPAAQERVADASLMAGRTDVALGAVSGIRPGADPVVTITSARVWTITPTNGIAHPEGTGPAVGPYKFAFTANKTGTLDAADANFTRYDRVDIQVPDDPAGASPLAPVYIITKGQAQSQPVVPPAPPRSFPFGVFTVPNSGNPSFAATYPYCASSGGIIPTRSGYRPANPYKGQYIDDAVLGLLRYDGASWARSYLPGKRCKAFTNTTIGATTGSVILDTGLIPTTYTDCPHLVQFSTYVNAQTLAANQKIGILVQFYSDAGVELGRVEFDTPLLAAADSSMGMPISARWQYAAGAGFRVVVTLVRRGGTGNISATPGYQSLISDEPVTLIP